MPSLESAILMLLRTGAVLWHHVNQIKGPQVGPLAQLVHEHTRACATLQADPGAWARHRVLHECPSAGRCWDRLRMWAHQ